MFDLTTPWWEIVLRAALIYIVVLVLLRVAAERELGPDERGRSGRPPRDRECVQNAMLGGDNSLIGRIIAASTLVAMNLVFARVANRIPLEHLFTSSPTLLIERAGSSKSNWKTRT